ncbi:hypothetical protein WJX74_010975 [Apatococcus lobatus]|uniref:Uncharacterized protein n=1 Tax=Apatococcus lobatus TaxID=904363 RepID=A0AAW1S434_9CHLO
MHSDRPRRRSRSRSRTPPRHRERPRSRGRTRSPEHWREEQRWSRDRFRDDRDYHRSTDRRRYAPPLAEADDLQLQEYNGPGDDRYRPDGAQGHQYGDQRMHEVSHDHSNRRDRSLDSSDSWAHDMYRQPDEHAPETQHYHEADDYHSSHHHQGYYDQHAGAQYSDAHEAYQADMEAGPIEDAFQPSESHHYHDRASAYRADLEAGLDGDALGPSESQRYHDRQRELHREYQHEVSDRHPDRYPERTSRRPRHSEPSPSLHIKGLPEHCKDEDLYRLFGAFHGIEDVRVLRDRSTGRSRGYAFMDFVSVEAAQEVFEAGMDDPFTLEGEVLRLDYSHNPPPAAAQAANDQGLSDWICDMCQAVNFSRRPECFQCSTPRPSRPRRLQHSSETPSQILKVGGLEPHATEEMLQAAFVGLGGLEDVRIIRDKQTGACRGFGFVHFATISDATIGLQERQGITLQGQQHSLRLSYAWDRANSRPAAAPAAAAAAPIPEALQAAQAMQQYSGWAPKEFDDITQARTEQQGNAQGGQAAGHSQPGPQSSDQGADAINGGNQQQQQQQAMTGSKQSEPGGFQYDQASGYWHDPSTGYYYDANTGQYYNSQNQQWLMYDQTTGLYTPSASAAAAASSEQQQQQQQQQQISQPAQMQPEAAPGSSPPGTSAAAYSVRQDLSALHAPEIQLKPLVAAPAATSAAGAGGTSKPQQAKRGAVIGAAPKLNPEGLLAAAREEKAKKDAAAKKAQQAAERKAKQKQKQAPPAPRPKGLLAGMKASAKQDLALDAAADPEAADDGGLNNTMGPPPPKPPASGTAAPPGNVQGIIHRGKWSKRNQ